MSNSNSKMKLEREKAHIEIAEVESALRAGYPPLSLNPQLKSAAQAAADSLGADRRRFVPRVGGPRVKGRWEKKYGLKPDWSLYKAAMPEAPVQEQPSDPIEVRRMRDEINALRNALKDTERRAAAAEEHRASILRLIETPPTPKIDLDQASHDGQSRQAVILHISDLHAGEVIRSSEMMGANCYDMEVFRARIGRLFETGGKLCTSAWPASDEPPEFIAVCLGGDLVSGSIHPELAETNEGSDYQIMRECAERIAGGIEHLHLTTQLPIRVFSVPGNHGRQHLKPRAKLQAMQSWDMLVADFVEFALAKYPEIRFFRGDGIDCYFDVVGWPILLTHGHNIGAGGGNGYLGPMANIVRGHRKTIDTEWRQRRPVYLILSGHFHTSGVTPFGVSNGSVVGYGEFAKSIRADPEPAKQSMIVIHERMGLVRWQPIYVGRPNEGSLYRGFGGWLRPQMDEYAEAA